MKVALNSIVLYSFLLLVLLVGAIRCEEHFSSLVQLEKLAEQEGQLVKKLRAIANELNDDYVSNKVQYFLDEHDYMQQDVAEYIENPLHGFGMIKRATADLSLLMERIPKEQAVVLEAHRIHETSLEHAVKCLLLIQRIYKLPTRDIARGIIHNHRIGVRMTPHDLFVIGNVASNLTNEEFFAKEYFELALEKKKGGFDKLNEINELHLLLKVAQLCERMHDYRSAGLHLKQLMLSDTSNIEVAQYALRIVKMFQEHGNSKLKIDHPYNDDDGDERDERAGQFSSRQEFSLMSDVCRGKLNRNEAQTNLHCRYFSTAAYSQLMPFRVEVVNADPYILLYHDVLSEAEIQSLKIFVREQKANEKSIRDVIRWRAMYDKDNRAIARISRRIEDMTGLSMDAEEPLNLQHFGIGGPFWRDQRIKRHKMAMILFYMNDDHMDGATAFPHLKLQVSPPKGSALFWFTLKPSGQNEYGTRFTQCPVTLKSKWIASKNIYVQKWPLWYPLL